MAVVGYVRVSTPAQNAQLQVDALMDAGATRIFSEVASGATQARPELEACLDYLRPGDTLAVWRMDRLGRSVSHLVGLVAQLRDRGIDFASLTEAFDTSTPGGEMVFHVFAAAAGVTQPPVPVGTSKPSADAAG